MAMDDLEAKAREIVNRSYTDYERGDFGEGLVKYFAQALRDEREACAKVVPTSWLDPVISKMGHPPYWCTDVESLLTAIAAAIRQGRT